MFNVDHCLESVAASQPSAFFGKAPTVTTVHKKKDVESQTLNHKNTNSDPSERPSRATPKRRNRDLRSPELLLPAVSTGCSCRTLGWGDYQTTPILETCCATTSRPISVPAVNKVPLLAPLTSSYLPPPRRALENKSRISTASCLAALFDLDKLSKAEQCQGQGQGSHSKQALSKQVPHEVDFAEKNDAPFAFNSTG